MSSTQSLERRTNMTVANILKAPTSRIILSSAFSNRMLTDENALVHKSSVSVEEAKALVALAESASNIQFVNAINPRHESTVALAEGLTKSECVGVNVSLSDGDVVVIIQPSASSRNDTEFVVEHFNECIFQVIQQLPLSMLQK
jgi:hypothetical protein